IREKHPNLPWFASHDGVNVVRLSAATPDASIIIDVEEIKKYSYVYVGETPLNTPIMSPTYEKPLDKCETVAFKEWSASVVSNCQEEMNEIASLMKMFLLPFDTIFQTVEHRPDIFLSEKGLSFLTFKLGVQCFSNHQNLIELTSTCCLFSTVFGPSGAGKTRLCLEMLAKKMGNYINFQSSIDTKLFYQYIPNGDEDGDYTRLISAKIDGLFGFRRILLNLAISLGLNANQFLMFQLVFLQEEAFVLMKNQDLHDRKALINLIRE
ncbi:hypothetical protein ROZALSC1DRAFT_25995, partial [Rozella allomycis CSF55]